MSLTQLESLRREIAGTAAFRLTVRFAAIFVCCLLALDLGVGLGARWFIEHDTRAEIDEALTLLRDAYAEDLAGFESVVADVDGAIDEGEVVIALQTPEGRVIAGTLELPSPALGWTVFTPEGIDADEARWVKSVRLDDGNWLSAAASSERYHDVTELMLAGAGWAIAIGLPLALISGALLSRAVLGRLAPITETTARVRRGDLVHRAPLTGRGDEFDRLAGDINAMLDTIEDLTRNLRNVSVGIAHELRTPLTRIRNSLVEFEKSAGSDGAPASAAGAALAEIDAALATFDALLRIGQIEANAQREGFAELDFSELVASLAEVYQPVAAEQGKQIIAQVAPGFAVHGSRMLLTQMISNLLENAIEHTPSGTAIDVALTVAPQGRMLVVSDNGPGIPPDERRRVFDRFYRLDRSRTRPGSGLGLSLVKSICSLHGFSVQLSPEAPGTRFEVSL